MRPAVVPKELVVKMFHRKSRWERLSERMATEATKKPAVVAGAAAAGVAALTAASAAVSSYRRKSGS
jgi:hypothetical protein